MSASVTARTSSVDIGQILDDGPWTSLQKVVVVLAALSIVADGFDGQLIGYAIPSLIREWGVTRGDFAPVVASGLIGMGLGSAFAGLFADRFGRRLAVIGSIILFSVATCCIGFAANLWQIALIRFIAGLGIGGALPTSTTVTAEFTPLRSRTLAITATIVCVPFGGMLAGLFAGYVLPAFGWRGLFWIGGSLPLILAAILLFKLPESPRFLAHHHARWPELTRLLGRMSRPVPADASFFDSREVDVAENAGFRALFQQGRKIDTLALWIACFATLLAVYSAFSWLPTMLTNEGLSPAVAGSGLTAYNLGGVVGAMLCAYAITRFGSRWPLAIFSAGGALSAFLLMTLKPTESTDLLIFGVGVHGLFVTTVQCIIYSLCANVYPTNVRATGTAATLAVGRLGAILSAFAGAAMITAGGAFSYFALLGVAMVVALIALWTVRNQIVPVNKAQQKRPYDAQLSTST
ncbi:MFS transporter [uncultured Methylobacterium sp.]|jgi:AAHS family 4-hydroxybenzoate transporter-like MFS transporter|uniref:MFS transporter n=1 Tax=uncultured Methylobacterium sp. TaxID=157278 RepID=UPI00262A70E4|nr:MFS transporter [uncultured Methylobacterium sp.]